uniref:Ribosomal protein S11 n=1 Tax=Mesostigma viride TaxID=41882 RepID=Q8W9P7_MESVI|nr:ribosomal protein S11 [Mesostigma viride]AAL36761.1 ribosomal protein S11 [Mesostigma viride]
MKTTGNRSNKTAVALPIGILHVQTTLNNTIMTLTDRKGNTIFGFSSGMLGFGGSRKKTRFASRSVAQHMVLRCKQLRIQRLILAIKGRMNLNFLTSLIKKGRKISIVQIIDKTPKVHNGCRPPKMPRK